MKILMKLQMRDFENCACVRLKLIFLFSCLSIVVMPSVLEWVFVEQISLDELNERLNNTTYHSSAKTTCIDCELEHRISCLRRKCKSKNCPVQFRFIVCEYSQIATIYQLDNHNHQLGSNGK